MDFVGYVEFGCQVVGFVYVLMYVFFFRVQNENGFVGE